MKIIDALRKILVVIFLVVGGMVVLAEEARAVETALGEIDTTSEGITKFLMRLFIGMGLGVGVLKGSIAIWQWRNAESPDKKSESMQVIIAVIAGIVLMFMAIPLLRFIGIDILGIQNLGGGALNEATQP